MRLEVFNIFMCSLIPEKAEADIESSDNINYITFRIQTDSMHEISNVLKEQLVPKKYGWRVIIDG